MSLLLILDPHFPSKRFTEKQMETDLRRHCRLVVGVESRCGKWVLHTSPVAPHPWAHLSDYFKFFVIKLSPQIDAEPDMVSAPEEAMKPRTPRPIGANMIEAILQIPGCEDAKEAIMRVLYMTPKYPENFPEVGAILFAGPSAQWRRDCLI